MLTTFKAKSKVRFRVSAKSPKLAAIGFDRTGILVLSRAYLIYNEGHMLSLYVIIISGQSNNRIPNFQL